MIPTTPTSVRVSSTNLASSPHYATTRRHSLYGTEDRIVIDPGSRVWKVGFSGEGRPRDVFVAGPLWSFFATSSGSSGTDVDREDEIAFLEQKLQDCLRGVFFNSLLSDPRARKVIIVENPLLPSIVKETIARVLFQNLQVPSISFAPSHLLSLLAAGRMTGLVFDGGYLESTVLPVYGSRPLYPLIRTTPLAGARLTAHLKSLLLLFGTYFPPPSVVGSAANIPASSRAISVPPEILTEALVEDIKTRCCFVGEAIYTSSSGSRAPTPSAAGDDNMSIDARSYTPSESGQSQSRMSVDSDAPPASVSVLSSAAQSNDQSRRNLEAMRNLYAQQSSATDLTIRVVPPGPNQPHGPGTTARGTLQIPGWVRERAAEVLFEDGDVDESSVAEVILNTLLKVPVDLRKDLVSSILVVGGTSMLPGFIPRLQSEISRLLAPLSPPPINTATPESSSPPLSPVTPTVSNPTFRGRLSSNIVPTTDTPTQPATPRRAAYDPYAILRPLAPFIAILNNPNPPFPQSTIAQVNAGKAPAFAPAALPWIGGSLAGSLKTGGEEILRDQFEEAYDEALNPAEVAEDGTPRTRTPPPIAQPDAKVGRSPAYVLPDWTRSPLGVGAPSVYALS